MNDQALSVIPKFDLVPQNVTEAVELAKLMAKSELVPKQYQQKPGDILIAVQMGMEFGLKPIQSLNSIAVINGRPTMWGDAVLAVVRASGLLESIEEREPSDALAAGEGSCTVKRRGEERPITRRFSIAEAQTAGLIERAKGTGRGDGPWITYPGRMLQMRARSLALRDAFPDVLKGMVVREEQQDIPQDAEGVEVRRPSEPRRKSEPLQAGDADRLARELDPPAQPARPGATSGRHAQAASGTVYRGRISAAEKKTSPKGKPYFEVKGDGDFRCTTFSESAFGLAQQIQAAGEIAQITYAVNGQYKNLTDIVSVGAPGEDEPRESGQEG